MTLTDIVAAITAHIDSCADPETGEISDEALERMEVLNLDLNQKADGYGIVYRACLASAANCEEEAKRFSRKAKAYKAKAERLRLHLMAAMEYLKLEKIETELGSATIQASPPKLVIDDESKVPMHFMTAPRPVINKAAVMEALKQGAEEAKAFAMLETGTHLRFR
jgi:hypothetical protein